MAPFVVLMPWSSAFSPVAPQPGSHFSAALQSAVQSASAYYNVSISAAFTLSDGQTFASAAGASNRMTSQVATTSDQYPAGSVTKTTTAVIALKLVEAGKLNLDDPVHKAVDPWLKTQGHKSLLELWHGNPTILTVTMRQLLQMRAGVADYDDAALREWTVQHPTKDYLPIDFVTNVDKKFLFHPGEGGAYSGVSYVLAGWTLCAAVGCKDWTHLDQQALLEEGSDFRFESSRFMTTGPCSQYEGVVHQYLFGSYNEQLRDGPGRQRPPLLADLLAAAPSHCSTHSRGSWYPGYKLEGQEVGRKMVESGGAEACCAEGDGTHGAQYWTFVADDAKGERGTCIFHEAAAGATRQSNATSGRTDSRLSATDFTDLYQASCLNGWTMGNIATTPTDLTRFYYATFAAGNLLSSASLAAMQTWKPLTNGFSAGTPYGLGLFHQTLRLPVKAKSCKGFESVCKCHLIGGCSVEATTIGHAGLDYGSGFPLIGFVEQLNLSYALGSNTGESPMGMNYTLGTLENSRLIQAVYCPFLQAAFQAQLPGFPDFECGFM